ncbi:MAG: cytochrome c oxidase subunit II [Armatimonadota bacterium]|nr:cytochrome c oxidase subunit II [Armatimonadota bacterium]MDR7468319.1 cytochrome c oxidase subunit II [Armatimonadota bacterium]MDR7492622.1 cytochrome c oxidase subunit II [Armatimonadota bacterium]MDR7505887.1 cytochrome c oxidase subunit II [Armatimonadota bacterium]MDR7547450.1 cytochrome c oxidase subunit II [Armatimonadota bacterium]
MIDSPRDADAPRTGRRYGLVVLLFVALGGALSFALARTRWWLPPGASTQAAEIDRLFTTTLIVTGIVFVLVHIFLAVLIWQGGRRTAPAAYWHDNRTLELTYTLAPAAILVTLIAMGAVVWARVHAAPPPDALVVEVRAEQFGWVFRYPGADGQFGRTDATRFLTRDNPLGIDPTDPAGRDDIVARELHLIAGRPVHIRLSAKDVLHSFFVPQFRVKQDAVPGMVQSVVFEPTRAGTYEIACAELCGVGHYIMRGKVVVETRGAFETWLAAQQPFAP